MRLNKKILLITSSILSVSLLTSAIINIANFRKNYTEALITGSYGLGHSLNSVVTEMINLGLPIETLSGMDKKLKQLVDENPHIIYAGISDTDGKVIFHNSPEVVGKVFSDAETKKSIATAVPLTQRYQRFDGYEYFDVTIPVFDSTKTHIAQIRMGFRTEVVNAKVRDAIMHVAINFSLSFLIVVFLINLRGIACSRIRHKQLTFVLLSV